MIKLVQRPLFAVVQAHRRRTMAATLFKSTQAMNNEFTESFYNDTVNFNLKLWSSLIVALVTTKSVFSSKENQERIALCDYKTTSELPNFGSSSDPVYTASYPSDEETEFLVVAPTSFEDKAKANLDADGKAILATIANDLGKLSTFDSASIEAAWDATADQREQELNSGTVEAVPVDVAIARLEARFPG